LLGTGEGEGLLSDQRGESDDNEPGFFGSVYLKFDETFHVIFSWTVPTPPHEGAQSAEDLPSGLTTALGLCGSFVWLAGLSEAVYYLVLIICDATHFLSPMALGAILLSAGAQIPDALAAASMAKAGHSQGAISSTLASQIIALTLGFGLPWTIYIGMGNSVQLATTSSTEITDGTLLGIVFLLAVTFLITTVLTPSTTDKGFVEIGRTGSAIVGTCFCIGLVGFVVIEGLYQSGEL
jgi:Ca2+/Na+ antiporter